MSKAWFPISTTTIGVIAILVMVFAFARKQQPKKKTLVEFAREAAKNKPMV